MDYYKRVEDGKTKVIQDSEVEEYPDAEYGQYGMKAYWAKKNLRSLDGLPGIQTAHRLDFEPRSEFSVEECAGINWESQRHDQRQEKKDVLVVVPKVETQNLKLVAAFVLGMLLTATYSRLTKVL